MARKKNIVKNLLDAGEAAFYAGIEIHNKPMIPYRYSTATMLIVNAWELVLKAYVYKYINKKLIYEKDNHTISFSKALTYTHKNINKTEGNKNFTAVKDNLFLLAEYRNNSTHYFEKDLDPIIFMLLSKATLNFNSFLEKYFNREVTRFDNLIILPIGFNLPFNPVDYLKKNDSNNENSFLNEVIRTIHTLQQDGIEDSIVVGFNMFMSSVKNITNADIIAAIDPSVIPDITFSKEYRITDNPAAPAVRIDEESLIKGKYHFTHNDVANKLRETIPNFKQNKIFYSYLKLIKKNKDFYMERLLNPLNPKSSRTGFYSQQAIDALVETYSKNIIKL